MSRRNENVNVKRQPTEPRSIAVFHQYVIVYNKTADIKFSVQYASPEQPSLDTPKANIIESQTIYKCSGTRNPKGIHRTSRIHKQDS